ncbi:MAG: adenylosuccinate lyase [Actinobacteria bacterium]|nr:adenylosuccinate lyase [Actinomycetota bacterium]
MIPRYSPKAMAALFTDEARFAAMLEVELLAAEALVGVGVVPEADAKLLRERAPQIDAAFVAEVGAREEITNHDVAAFVDIVQDRIGAPEGSWIHYGLTSSDVVDTALCTILTKAADLLIIDAKALEFALEERARELASTPVTGRTHGMHAEPTTFGAKFALFALQVRRDLVRLSDARAAVAVGKLSGAVGTYSNIDPSVEAFVCSALGLTPVPATQVVARDRHAQLLYACATLGATIEAIALEVRHLARSEVGEAEEPFGKGQKGSSAMPHKRNPILSENLCGLARIVRAAVTPALEDVALWHERDISHSSVERMIAPDVVVHADRAAQNLTQGSFGLVFSQSVLLALVDAGLTRDAAYRIVQRDARQAWEERRDFRSILEADPEVTVAPEVLDRAFDLGRLLTHASRFIDALDA